MLSFCKLKSIKILIFRPQETISDMPKSAKTQELQGAPAPGPRRGALSGPPAVMRSTHIACFTYCTLRLSCPTCFSLEKLAGLHYTQNRRLGTV